MSFNFLMDFTLSQKFISLSGRGQFFSSLKVVLGFLVIFFFFFLFLLLFFHSNTCIEGSEEIEFVQVLWVPVKR